MSKRSSPPPPAAGATVSHLSAEEVQRLIDRAAHFNMLSLPARSGNAAISAPGDRDRIIGFEIREALLQFGILGQPPTARAPLTARNVVGEPAGTFSHRWLLMPPDFVAAPDREPPATPFDPKRSQRFVMMDSRCRLGSGKDGFRGFGTGQTLPTTVGGRRRLLVTAIGTILEGFGRLKGHEEGTYVYCGRLEPRRGFTGNVLLRVMDMQETFRAETSLPPLAARRSAEPGITYLLCRGQAVPGDPVTPRAGPDGRPLGLIVEQGLELLNLDFSAGSHGGLLSTARVGPPIGKITATITFDPTAPGGTLLDPIPFTTDDEFVFLDWTGQRIGSFTADSSEGRVFHTALAGQPGIRFGGTGRVLSGAGPFAGIKGLMTDNSVVVFEPHVSASVYVLRLEDPRGKFRA